MTESLLDAELLATRSALEVWLSEHSRDPDGADDLASSNLILWARSFLRVTALEANAYEIALKRQGALEFARSVLNMAAVSLVAAGAYDPSVLGLTFVSELAELEKCG